MLPSRNVSSVSRFRKQGENHALFKGKANKLAWSEDRHILLLDRHIFSAIYL